MPVGKERDIACLYDALYLYSYYKHLNFNSCFPNISDERERKLSLFAVQEWN